MSSFFYTFTALIFKNYKMKKLYILTFSIAISFVAIGQVQSQIMNKLDYSKENNNSVLKFANQDISLNRMSSILMPNIVWESDFSDPNDWTMDNTGAFGNEGWNIDAVMDSWYLSAFSSTSGGNFAELGNGDPTAGGAWPIQVDYTLTTANPIDVYGAIGSGNATLSFEEYGARFNDLKTIQISTDGVNFITIGDNLSYPVTSQAAGSNPYPNPSLREINLAPYIGATPSSVWVRFSWTTNYPNQSTDPNVWVAYGWCVDDVKIIESPANKVTIHNAVTGGFWIDYANYNGSGLNDIYGLDYSVTPLSQIQSHPYAIEALFINEGTVSQTVNLTYDVTGASASNGSSSSSVLNPGDSIFLGASFSPTMIGNYTIDISGVADSAGAGVILNYPNGDSKDVEVSDYIYGKDLGVSNSMSSWKIGGPAEQWHFTTRYEMFANQQLYALRAYITNESVIGAEVKAIIYEADTTAADGLLFLAESDNYVITAADRGAWVDIPFVAPISLLSGYAYEFGIVGFNTPDSVFLGTSGQSMYNGEHSLFDEFGLSTQSAGAPTWYYLTATPMVRMNFDPSLISEVVDVKQNIFNVFPNPTNGLLNIELGNTEKYTVSVYNVLGQTVLSESANTISTVIDLSSFEKGVYMLELSYQDKILTKQIVVE